MDKNLQFQQHAGELAMPVIALVAMSNRMGDLTPLAPEVQRLLGVKLQRRAYVVGPASTESPDPPLA